MPLADMIHDPAFPEATGRQQQDVVAPDLPPEMLDKILAAIELVRIRNVPDDVSSLQVGLLIRGSTYITTVLLLPWATK